MTKSEIRQALSDKIQKDGIVYLVGGALGELPGCNAYVEHTLKTPMWRTKYFGVSYWFKGIIDNDIIDRVSVTKRAFWNVIKLFGIFSIFRTKKIISALTSIYVCEGGLESKCLKLEEFCPACQELIKAGLKVVGEGGKDLIFCFAMFLQFSTTYRVYLQDILGEVNKENLKKHLALELIRLKNLFLSRVKKGNAKMISLVKMFFWAIIFKKKLIRDFLMELDIERVKLDESDRYFCLRRSSYDFGGKELYTRLVEAELIDKEQDNLILGI